MGRMPAIPASTRSSITLRLLDHAEKHWPQLETVEVTCRAGFAYVTGVLPGGEQQPLLRLRYGGSAHSFGFAIYSAARDRYEDALLLTGYPTGTPQEALDTACTVHLAGLGHEPDSEPSTNLRSHPLSLLFNLCCPVCHFLPLSSVRRRDIRRPPLHHLRVLTTELEDGAVAVEFSMAWLEAGAGSGGGEDQARERLAGFRGELYRCLARRRDALFEVADAVLCRPGRVGMLAELSLEPACRRGHGAVYDALNCGDVRVARLRWALAALPLPAWPDGRIRLAVDVSNWLRPDAATSPQRLFCHCYGRGKNSAQMIPGWPYSFVAALEPGRTSWVRLLDAVRLGPADDLTAMTAAQVREIVQRIIAAGHWRQGDPPVMVIFDAGYEPARLAWLLRDLPVQVIGRLGSNRVLRHPPAPPARPDGPASAPRARIQARRQHAPRPGRDHHHRDQPVRHRHRRCLAPDAPQAVRPRRLGRPPGQATGHRGHRHPADRRSPASRPAPQAGVAVDFRSRRGRRRGRPVLAGIPAPL